MDEILIYIGFAAIGVFFLYLIVKFAIACIKREQFRKKNREAQFSGSAVNKERGFWASVFSSSYSRAEYIGDNGERKVSFYLSDLECRDYQVFNDLLIINGNYTTQIDHVIISRYGVFVIETKNVHGKVYGSGNAEFWKQYLPDIGYKRFGSTQEHQLRNPIWQNVGHIKSLRRLVFDNGIPIYGIVVFPYETELHVKAEQPVLKMWQVVPYIKQFRDKVLSSDQMSFYRRCLLEVISTTEFYRKQHLENVYRNKERRDAAIADGKCPRCGGKLVLRSGKYGSFYGCSSYPKCNYTHPTELRY
ncbi:MAG: NERD domain-containing protein [Bacteroidales bacterium]|nr:NERD domain-containing protein [Bacteroidales bacterium]